MQNQWNTLKVVEEKEKPMDRERLDISRPVLHGLDPL